MSQASALPSASRIRWVVAMVLLMLLVGLIVAVGTRANFRTAPSVDSRTYIEMIRGFADNGLPYLDNPPAADWHEGQARWNIYRDGHLWGAYPPLFPFLASFVFRARGLPAVTQVNCIVCLGLVALGTAALGTRLTRDPIAGAAAAYAALLATFVGIFGLGIDSFALCTALTVWSCYCGLRSVDDGTARWPIAAGALGGLAVASHLIALPLLGGVIAAIALGRRDGDAALVPTPPPWPVAAVNLRPWIPSRQALGLALLAVVAGCIVLLPVMWVNHLRFDSFSPVTYGPCVWQVCMRSRLQDMTLGKSLAFGVPVVVWVVGAALAAAILPRRAWRWPLVVVTAVAVFFVWPALRQQGLDILACAVAYVADNATFAMPPFTKPADGLGNFFGPFVVKSLLQGSPYVALAFVAPWVVPEPRRIAALLLPVVALLAALSLRANLQFVHALGFPFLVLRYLAPAMPLLAVLAVATARGARFGVVGWVVFVVTAAGAGYGLWSGDDAPLWRRVLILRVTLAVGIGAAACAILQRRAPILATPFNALAGAALGLSVAISMSVDLHAIWLQRTGQDAMLARAERTLPQRFAVVGWAPQLDPILSLRATHDIEYLDFFEASHWGGFRAMIDRWNAGGRPIYAFFPPGVDVKSPWPDVWWEPLDPHLALFLVRTR